MSKAEALRDFVRMADGRVGVIIANDRAGGVFRGHAEVWFGALDKDGIPVLVQVFLGGAVKAEVPFSYQSGE